VPNNESWNYGRQGFDRRRNLQFNWAYDIPNLGKKLNSKLLGVIYGPLDSVRDFLRSERGAV